MTAPYLHLGGASKGGEEEVEMNKKELRELIIKGEDSFTEFKEEKIHPDDPQRPYRTNKGIHYIRTASGKRIASPGELKLIHQGSGDLYYDELPIPNTSIKDIRLEYLEEFLERFLENTVQNLGIKTEDLLRNMKILTPYENNLVTSTGGLLFFGKKPEYHLPYCKVTIVRFFGNDIAETFEKKDIEGRLTDQIERTEIILKDYLRSKTKIEGFKKGKPRFEIPIESIREAIINAIAHRNYQLPSQIRIFIFDNRIEIKSPGRLPNTVTIENIKFGFPLHRNPLIVSLLAKEHRMTEIGTGVPRMIRLLKEYTNREPEFEERAQEFIVRIWRPYETDR